MDPANTTRGNVAPKASATESVPKVPAESPVVAGTAAGSRKPAAPAGAEVEAGEAAGALVAIAWQPMVPVGSGHAAIARPS
ncbi:MAG: hypothetical protein JW751_31095 [Polyangiaceae bacterium]|nr:hypothetical protein [Polyangiaceae bacterium]